MWIDDLEAKGLILTSEEWALVESMVPKVKGYLEKYTRRELLSYVLGRRKVGKSRSDLVPDSKEYLKMVNLITLWGRVGVIDKVRARLARQEAQGEEKEEKKVEVEVY